MTENKTTNPTNVSSHPIGMGEPVQEEVEKIKSFWDKSREFSKTGKFKIIAVIAVLIFVIFIVLIVIMEIPRNPVPPIAVPTPTPITFATPTTQTELPPLSSAAARLQQETSNIIYDNPDLAFPPLDWKITLQPKNP